MPRFTSRHAMGLVVSASVGDACIAAYFERTLPHHARIQLKTDRGDEANTYVQHLRREIFSEAQFRLATVRNATRILVFDRGRIVESGAFGTLVDRGGIFAALAKAQFMIGVEPK